MEAVRLVVRGRVQGVGYRAFLAGEAQRLGLRGWTRNRADGTVEALVGGSAEALSQLVAACRRGPRLAVVTDVEVTSESSDEIPNGFSVTPTV